MIRRHAILVLVLGALASQARASSWADELCQQKEHFFGTQTKGTLVSHNFTLTNPGAKEVRIKGVSVSCGCVKASASQTTMSPGESITVSALMDTSGYQGEKTVTIFVDLDRPKKAQLSLRVHCTSVGSVASGSYEIDFGNVGFGTSAEKRMILEYAGAKTWEVKGVDFSSPHLTADIKETSRDDKGVKYELKVGLKATAPNGIVAEKLKLTTNDTAHPEVVVQIKGKVESKIVVAPETLKYSNLATGQRVTKNLIIKAPKPFRVIRAENTHGLFEIRSSTDPKATQLVEVTLKVPDDMTQMTDRIELVTDLGEGQIITIPVQE